MSALRQATAVTAMNIAAMRARKFASLVVVVGMAAVVGVGLAIYSMSAGFTELIRVTVPTPDRMAIVSAGALEGGPSNIPRASVPLIAQLPGIMKGPDGEALISPVITTAFFAKKRKSGFDAFAVVAAVGTNVMSRRPEIKLTEGRMFTPGLRELIAGRGAVERFEDVAIGQEVRLPDGPWKIVGIFEGGGTSDNQLWAEADTLMSALGRNSYGVIYLRIADGSPEGQAAFKAAAASNPALAIEAESEYQNRSRGVASFTKFYAFLAYGVAAIMGLGTLCAAMNTMYATVAARAHEIATLRAIGFSAAPVVTSVMAETLVLTAIGGLLGSAAAWVIFDGRSQNFRNLAIVQTITPGMIAAAVGTALVVGLMGGLFPALRAARLPLAIALQKR